MNWHVMGGWIGGIAGGLIGLLGGVFGTYCSIKNTNGPRERAFVIRASVLGWIFVGLFIVGLMLIPQSYKVLLMILYPVLLVLGIWKWNQSQFRIRQEEQQESGSPGNCTGRQSIP
jgi:hypothetical protein